MKKRIVAILMLFVLLVGNTTIPVEAASLKLTYNGKSVTYTGKQIKIKINGTSKSISKTPGIMMGSGGYAMLPYYETFVTSSIKMNKTYYKTTKKLVLTYNNDTLLMTLNKKTATFNGKSVTLPVAPVSVKYHSSGVTRILVPGRKVAELFGLDYSWNSSTNTVAISSNNKISSSVSSSTAASGPTSYYRSGKRYTLTKRYVSYNGAEINLASNPACLIDKYNYIPYYYAFVKNGPKIQRKYSSSTKQITLTSTINGKTNKLVMKVNSKKATLNGKSVTLPRAPLQISFSKNGKKIIYVPAKVVGTLLGYAYSYNSSTKMISYVPGLSIKMNNSYSVYTRTQVSINANNKTVSTAIPGILEGNSTLIPGKAVSNSAYGLGISYSYKSNKATFKRGNTTVVMTKNSKTAKVNGKNKTMSVPMRMIMLTSNGSTYVMVPGEFLMTELGLNYQYVNGISNITIPSATNSTTQATPPTPPSNSDTTNSFVATITLAKPTGLGNGVMSCVDDYHNKRLVVSVPGNYSSYYNSNKPALPSGVTYTVKYVSSNNTTQIIFTTSEINGFRVQEDANYLYIMNGKPKDLFKNVIVLDAGHGGSDSGAVGNGYYEKDFTLSIVQAAKTYFDTNSDYKVYYTRLNDTYPSLSDRYKLANNVEADIFISVHINSAGATATGTETLYNPDRNKVSAAGLSCYQLAHITQQHVKAATGFADRGLKQRCTRLGNGLAVLNNNNGPATLTEIGFISNHAEAIAMATNLNNYGLAVYNAVVNASISYPTNR